MRLHSPRSHSDEGELASPGGVSCGAICSCLTDPSVPPQVNYVVQEAIVVIKDIFRKYPNKYESIISTLCENLDTLDEPEAR